MLIAICMPEYEHRERVIIVEYQSKYYCTNNYFIKSFYILQNIKVTVKYTVLIGKLSFFVST